MDTSPKMAMATSWPRSKWRRTASAASRWAARCLSLSRDMVKNRGRRVFPSRSTTCRAMLSAVISPEAVWGAASTGQDSSTRTAFSVSSSGSPGPTPTP